MTTAAMRSSIRQAGGVTLLELLIAMIIGSIAFFALAVPFVAERSFWNTGARQAEAQRDAQFVLRAIARIARQSSGYAISEGGAKITFTTPGGPASCVRGGATYSGQMHLYEDCGVSPQLMLIDGVRSRVTTLAITAVTSSLVHIQLRVTHQNQQDEQLDTDLFLRNAA